MKLTIESTEKLITINGVPARIWEGETASGVPVHCYITRVSVDRDHDTAQFDRELEEHRAPSPAVAAIPARLLL